MFSFDDAWETIKSEATKAVADIGQQATQFVQAKVTQPLVISKPVNIQNGENRNPSPMPPAQSSQAQTQAAAQTSGVSGGMIFGMSAPVLIAIGVGAYMLLKKR